MDVEPRIAKQRCQAGSEPSGLREEKICTEERTQAQSEGLLPKDKVAFMAPYGKK